MTEGFSSLTEAELQARFSAALNEVLPRVAKKFRLERHLHFKLGHHEIAIDGWKPGDTLRGRYDVLVEIDGRPLLIVELKAPAVAITAEDIRQGLSYARLHDPPVPLLFATNGTEKKLCRAYDGQELDAAIPSEARLAELLAQAATLAAADSEQAVRTLLGAAPETWIRIFRDWSTETIADLTGSARDFRKPIVSDFSFAREVEAKIAAELVRGTRVVLLHGAPISGVSNVLAHVAVASSTGPRLLLQTQTSLDVLQSIANRLTTELKIGISKDDLRAWFGTCQGVLKIVLVLDGYPWQSGDELLEWARSGQLQLVFGMHSEARRQAISLPGRSQSSLLGNLETPIELEELSDAEFEVTRGVYWNAFTACFAPGAETAPNLRSVRSHRIIAATLPAKQDVPSGLHSVIPTFSSPRSLIAYNNAFVADPSVRSDFQRLARVYLREAEKRYRESEWSHTWGLPSLDPQLAETALGRSRLEEFVRFGFLSWVEHPKLRTRILVRLEEVFAHYIAEQWAAELAGMRKLPALLRKIAALEQLAFMVPEGDTAFAAAIYRAGQKDNAVLSVCISWLLNQRPTQSRLKTGRKLQVLLKGQDVTLHLGEGIDEPAIGNFFPWMVLSRCAYWPMAVADSSRSGNFLIFAEVGKCPLLIRPLMHLTLQRHQPIALHEIEGLGTFQCIEAGIVEPLVAAMIEHARSEPDEFRQLAAQAVADSDPHLIWRIHIAAKALENYSKEEISNMASEIASQMNAAFDHLVRLSLQLKREPKKSDPTPHDEPSANQS